MTDRLAGGLKIDDPADFLLKRIMTFLIGDEVEVREKSKRLRGPWLPARVIGVLDGKRLVEFEKLGNHGGLTKCLELVILNDGLKLSGSQARKTNGQSKQQYIRPRPPPLLSSPSVEWSRGTWVDCLEDGGWWEGLLTEDVCDKKHEYGMHTVLVKEAVLVVFPGKCSLTKIDVKDIKISQEWDDFSGKWTQKRADPLEAYREMKAADANEDKSGEQQRETKYFAGRQDNNLSGSVAMSNEELLAAGWEVSQTVSAGTRRWSYKSPKIATDPKSPRSFPTLSAALSYLHQTHEAGVDFLTSPASTHSPVTPQEMDQKNAISVNQKKSVRATHDAAASSRTKIDMPSENYHLELSDDNARAHLKMLGWQMTKASRFGKSKWTYRPPRAVLASPNGNTSAKALRTLCGALEEHNRRIRADQEGKNVTLGLARNRSSPGNVIRSNTTTPAKNTRESTEIEGNVVPVGENLDRGPEVAALKNDDSVAEERRASIETGNGSDRIHRPLLSEVTLIQRSQDDVLKVNKLQLQHDSRTGQNKASCGSKFYPETRNSSSHLRIELTNDEARDHLKAAGWVVDETTRKYKHDWVYKSPTTVQYPGRKMRSLCTAIAEYNQRARYNNEDRLNDQATIVLVRTHGGIPQLDTPKN